MDLRHRTDGSTSYGCTGAHGSDILDYNECMQRLYADIAMLSSFHNSKSSLNIILGINTDLILFLLLNSGFLTSARVFENERVKTVFVKEHIAKNKN